MADARSSGSVSGITGKRAFAARINKRNHVAARREAASMYLPDNVPGFGQNPPTGLLQVIVHEGARARACLCVRVCALACLYACVCARAGLCVCPPLPHFLQPPSLLLSIYQGINPALYGSGSTSSSQQMLDVIEPLDFEEYMTAQQTLLERDPMKHLLEFPTDDIMVSQLPPKCRTTEPILPEEG